MKICFSKTLCYLIQKHNHLKFEEKSGIDITDEVVIEKTSKGGNYILHNNFRFVKSSSNNDKVHYRCSLYNKKCKARISVIDDKILMHLAHNHDRTE
jgi:hypothetical protein